MASGPKKKKAALFRLYVSNPAGYAGSITAAEQIGETANQLNLAIYASGGYAPTFTNGSTTLLSDAKSNQDNCFTRAGLTGETTQAALGAFVSSSMSGAIGINSSVKHYYFPKVSSSQVSVSTGLPIIIYSGDGPRAKYVPYYQGAAISTASILFDSKITGSGAPTHISVYVGGELATGDQIRLMNAAGTILQTKFLTGSDTAASALTATSATASAAQLSAALYRKAFLIPTGNVATGMVVEFSSSAKTSTTPVAGVFIAIGSGSYP